VKWLSKFKQLNTTLPSLIYEQIVNILECPVYQSAFSEAIVCVGFSDLKTVLPATKTSAPAAKICGAF
jgi:hypothetical protein